MGRGVSENLISTAGGILGGMVLGPAGAAAGSTLGSLAEGDDFGEAMMGGLLSFGVGSALQGLSGTASALGDNANLLADSGLKAGTDEATKAIMKDASGKVIANQGITAANPLFKDAVTNQAYGYESITDGMFGGIDTNTIGNISKGADAAGGWGNFLGRAIKNPKVYTGLGAAGIGLAGQMEPPPIEAPAKRTYAARPPNLTTGPARAKSAPGADYAPGYDPEFDYGFAEGGVVSGNRNYQTGNLIDQIVNRNPQNPGEVISNVGTGLSVANTFGNIGAPGLGTAVGALGGGLAANAYQDDLASRGINTDYNARGTLESDNPNFISGAESMLNSATMGYVGRSPKERYDEIIRRAKAMTTPRVVDDGDISPDLTISPTAPVSSVTSSDMAPVDGDDEDDGMEGPTIDLNAISNLPSVETLTDQQKLDAGVVTTPPIVNELAVQNAVTNAARDAASADVIPQSFTDADLGPTGWANVSPQAFADPSFGEQGLGSSWAGGGLVPGSMNQPQKRYFGIYKQGGPVRSYALGENVDAIEGDQVQQNPIVVEAVAAITGNHPEPEAAIMQFIKIYGEEAFAALREEVVAEASSGDRQASGLGALSGPGTGLSDDIPAEVQQGGLREPAALSVGEQVIPADALAMLGDGSTEAGSRKIDNMVDEIRMQKTGTTKQAGPLDMSRVESTLA